MPFSTRELLLIMRARDEASRAVRGLSRELLGAGTAAQIAAMRAQAATLRQQAAIMKHTGATKAQIDAVNNAAKAYDNQARAARVSAMRTEAFAAAAQQAGQTLMTMGTGMVVAGSVVIAGLIKATQAAYEYERQVRLTKTQVDGFEASLSDLSRIGLKVANSVAVPFKEIQPALYDIFSSTNANLKQSEILLVGFAKAAVAGQVSIQSASRATMAIMNAYNIPLEDVNSILDIQFQLVRKGVGTYAEFAAVIGNVIPASTRAGQSFEMVAAMLAYLTRNGLSAAMSATSAARALETMSNPKVVSRLKDMGINALDAAGNFRPLNDVLLDLRNKIMQLPPADRVAALMNLMKGAGSTIQARRFLEQVILRPGELEEFIGYLNSMKNSSGQFEDAYNTMADSVASKTQLLRNQWEVFKVQIGQAFAPIFEKLVSALSKVLEWFNSLDEGTRNNIVTFIAIGAILSVVAGAILVVVGVLAMLIGAVAAAGTGFIAVIAIIGAAALAIAGLVAAIVVLYNKSDAFKGLFDTIKSGFIQLKDIVKQFASEMKAEWDDHIAPPLERLRAILEERVIPAFTKWIDTVQSIVMPKIREAAVIIREIAGKAFEWIGKVIDNIVVPAISKMSDWWDKNKQNLEPLISIFAQVIKWMMIIGAVVTGVLVAVFVGPLIAAVVAVIAVFMGIINTISKVVGAVKELGRIIGGLGGFFSSMWNSAHAAFFQLLALVASLPGKARDALGSLGSLLISAGRDLIQGLIRGIDSMIGSLRNKLSSVTNMIPDIKGPPAKDKMLLFNAGRLVMQGFMRGVDSVIPSIKAQMGDFTYSMSDQQFTAKPYTPPRPWQGEGNGGNVYNNTFNITTTSSDPVAVASELGWEVENRIGV